MKQLDDNYYDVFTMITKLKGIQYDIENDIKENGGDGPDWEFLSGYQKCIKDLEKLVQEEDNV